jgi:hypothetical protein
MQALLGFTSEARWLRYARTHLRDMFPHVPQQPGYNMSLRALAATMAWLIAVLARDTSVWSDDVWVADSTPVECGRSRETPGALSWPGGQSMGTAPATRAASGGCGCICATGSGVQARRASGLARSRGPGRPGHSSRFSRSPSPEFAGGRGSPPVTVIPGHGRPRPVPNAGAHAWKACFCRRRSPAGRRVGSALGRCPILGAKMGAEALRQVRSDTV